MRAQMQRDGDNVRCIGQLQQLPENVNMKTQLMRLRIKFVETLPSRCQIRFQFNSFAVGLLCLLELLETCGGNANKN